MSCIFPLICPFLCSIASFAASFRSPQAKLHIPPPFAADLSWVRFIAQNLQNKMPLAPSVPVDLSWWGNASTSFGIRIVLGPHWAVWKWAPGFSVGPQRAHNIGWAEAVAVELGLRIAISLHFLSSSMVGGLTFLVRSDNAGIVSVMNKGCSHSWESNKILKHVYLLQAQHQIQLRMVHVTSWNNISDALSRGAVSKFPANFPVVNSQVSVMLPDHLVGKLISL